MANKKIIEKHNVKENNPNDDEEILKNNPDLPTKDDNNEHPDTSTNKKENRQGRKSLEVPDPM